MHKKRYAGVLLLVIGSLFLLLGVVLTWGTGNALEKKQIREEELVSSDQKVYTGSKLIVSLPAPGSIVWSPLLVRGKTYGSEKKVGLQLKTVEGEVVVETVTEVREEVINNQSVSLWQTSLVFNQPESNQAWLEVRLLEDNDTIVEKERIPLIFR